MKLTKKEITKLAVEAQNLMSAVEDYKKMYQRIDEITLILQGEDLSGTGLAVVDNFAEKNVVWRPAGVRRFELKKVA
jgi:hypothetical protein